MKCSECTYKNIIEGVGPEHDGNIVCRFTGEEHIVDFDCNYEPVYTRRENEARLLAEREKAAKALTALNDKLAGPRLDLEYVYRTLHEIREEVESTRLEELIQYIEGYL